MTTKAYFCCNPTDDTLIFYDSAEEAEEAARHAIEHATDGDWHPEVLGICWGRVIESAEVAGLHEHASGSACVEAGSGGPCSAGVPVHVDFGGKVTLRRHEVPDDDPATTRIAALEAEVSQLRAMLEEREVALAVQEGRLHGGPAELALMQLRTELRIHWYDYVDLFGETEATVYAPPEAEAQVTAAMAAVDLWRVRREVFTVVRAVYSTDGDRLCKAGGAR